MKSIEYGIYDLFAWNGSRTVAGMQWPERPGKNKLLLVHGAAIRLPEIIYTE